MCQSKTVLDWTASVWFVVAGSLCQKSNSWFVSLSKTGKILVLFLALHSSTCWFFQFSTQDSVAATHQHAGVCSPATTRRFIALFYGAVREILLWLCWRHLKYLSVVSLRRGRIGSVTCFPAASELCEKCPPGSTSGRRKTDSDLRRRSTGKTRFITFSCGRIVHEQGRWGQEVKAFWFFYRRGTSCQNSSVQHEECCFLPDAVVGSDLRGNISQPSAANTATVSVLEMNR